MGSIKGFVDIFDILRFVTDQLLTQFKVQIDFKAQDVARQSLHGREHLQQAWAVHEQHQVNMAADVLRSRLLMISLPGASSAMHNTPVSAIMSAECRSVRPGFSVSDVSGQLSQSSTHRVPLVGWDQKPLAIISQLNILGAAFTVVDPPRSTCRVGSEAARHHLTAQHPRGAGRTWATRRTHRSGGDTTGTRHRGRNSRCPIFLDGAFGVPDVAAKRARCAPSSSCGCGERADRKAGGGDHCREPEGFQWRHKKRWAAWTGRALTRMQRIWPDYKPAYRSPLSS